MKLKDFASLEVSKKKKSNSDKYFNKNFINDILKDTEKNNETIQNFLNNFDKDGVGNPKTNFWANLIDYRQKYVYKEKVFQGNIFR